MLNRCVAKKRRYAEISNEKNQEEIKVYNFKVLLPNGTSVGLRLEQPGDQMHINEFLELVRAEHKRTFKDFDSSKSRRKIFWNSESVYLEDATGCKIRYKILFCQFLPKICHFLILHDGQENMASSYENMWDLTSSTNLLTELPESYTFVTALADLIDNSLQAVWSNNTNERKMISVTVDEARISIFDTGPGMDETEENSIAKWGEMGASLHRLSKRQAVGGKPPYLKPFFGMFGYGGPIASMHIGRHTVVSSKRKESKKVYHLHLKREALLHGSGGASWKTGGGLRDPLEDEKKSSPHGSFTKVEIFKPKQRPMDVFKLQCRLKDIYFPYIQCDELTTGKTSRPVEFQVNGEDLAEIEGGEVAITNLHSCNGPEFVLQVHLLDEQSGTLKSPGSRAVEANARLKCVYFPVSEGKETFDRILEKLEDERCVLTENFNSFCRVSIRRLGRLLPDARWPRLPFMELKHRKGDKAQLLKRCCLRVKCFIDTDAGFNPTPSKTDLAQHHRFTTALKNIGSKLLEKDDGVTVEIRRDQRSLSLSQLEKEYEDWILQMHDAYDKELSRGQDPPILVVNPSYKKGLRITSEVVRVHKFIKRKGESWKAGDLLKIIPLNKQKIIYATLEFILLEGFQGDSGGEAHLICRPIDLPADKGCLLDVDGENSCLDVQDSLSFPINVIDSGQIDAVEWQYQLDRLKPKAPSRIDLLSPQQCQQLQIDGALPVEAHVLAGHATPEHIIAVIRPASFTSSGACKTLEQKFILKQDLEMSMEVKCIATYKNLCDEKHIYSERVRPSSNEGFHGLYIFSLGSKFPGLFSAAGAYTFKFSVICTGSREINGERKVLVKSRNSASQWRLTDKSSLSPCSIRVGSCLPPLAIACYDKYDNHMPFMSIPELDVAINMNGTAILPVEKLKVELLSSNMILQISDILIESGELDKIRPQYEASLGISCSHDKLISLAIPFLVFPGSLQSVKAFIPDLEKQWLPGDVIKEMLLEMYDSYGNHVQQGTEVLLSLDGFCFQDNAGPKRKVDAEGCINLNGILKVIGSFGKTVSFSVEYDGQLLLRNEIQIGERELRILTTLPDNCAAGSLLENIIFEVVDSNGTVDETIHDMKFGQSHMLTITSVSSEKNDCLRFMFSHGRCVVPFISVPREPGIFSFVAAHSCYPELFVVCKVNVMQYPKMEMNLVEHDTVPFQSPGGKMVAFQEEPVSALWKYNLDDMKKNEDDVKRIGSLIKVLESNLKLLTEEKASTENEISQLQDLYRHQTNSHMHDFVTDKEVVIKQIEMNNTAACVWCNIPADIQSQELPDVVGIVALLGSVSTESLSRMLAKYLGKELMLAVVCKSYAAARRLEKYGEGGEVDRSDGLHVVAAQLGRPINCGFLVICLEDLCPFRGKFKSDEDPQKKLSLVDPILPTDEIPSGFLGHAVNMVDIEIQHLHTRTNKGYYLRETLFYLLFGELQVYGTREQMNQARAFIKHGAISLDGGILKSNGILSLGPQREPEVRFPVVAFEGQLQIAPNIKDIAKKIEKKRLELGEISVKFNKVSKEHGKTKKRLGKKMQQLERQYNELGTLLKESLLGSNRATDNPIPSGTSVTDNWEEEDST
ncbi:structural maintenance of chromosomes flexible hinge domain-containing protein GMI1-like isoform X2 [Papaver somniferum]|uniref:structural maintenance of chromosomes flexible hinge domain-containing protein GMI1-like isoform X2 n=1 Tax=Papaver somniferum TaxID=3469 RepID=UPI000E6F7DA4|nr:structural maintenance of chromosomes flexible hinge domain-containing protein GMI1-like isoform X2 [Papaver somniferum]